MSLDAHKVSDQVEWPHMFESRRRFGFGETLISWVNSLIPSRTHPGYIASWVKMIYAGPVCFFLTNGDRSSTFALQCSVQQGCPPSPALFAIALEPLALKIRQHSSIVGFEVGDVETPISLYADDLIRILKDSDSGPLFLHLVTSFGEISSYTSNWSKSDSVPLSDD